MNDQVAGILGAALPDMSGMLDASYFAESPILYNAQPSWIGGSSAAPTDTSKPSDIAAANNTLFQIQQPAETGMSSFRSPVQAPNSTGGSSERISAGGLMSGLQKDGRFVYNGEVFKSEDAFLNSDKNPNNSGEWFDNPRATTAFQVENFMNGAVYGMKAVSSIFNGYSTGIQYEMKAASSDYMARQNQRNADLMRSNIKEINRAAQSDVNVLSVQSAERKSSQRIAQSTSGFKVGAGSFAVLNNNTDFKTQYNASMIMLKAGLQGAEVLRQAGTYEAQGIMNKAEADIARMNADAAVMNGWVSGVAGALQSGTSFYVGRYGRS